MDKSGVWSTDGATACACTPGSSVSGMKVRINHAINLNADVTVQSGGEILVAATGNLSSGNSSLTIDAGVLKSYGTVKVKEITVHRDGAGLFYGPVASVSGFLVYGQSLFNSLATITNGSLELKAGSKTTAGAGWQAELPHGNLYNDGKILFKGACLILTHGNFENQSNGSVEGFGCIQTRKGNIVNHGAWDQDIDWCAGGKGSNLVMPENCMAGRAWSRKE